MARLLSRFCSFLLHDSVTHMEEYSLAIPIPPRPSSARPVVIIQARMGSTRLPGKVMMPLNGVPMLQGMLKRLLVLQPRVPLILATTTQLRDQTLVDVAQKKGVAVFQGSEEDVLGRFAKAVATTSADAVVRLTGDCPLIDPTLIDAALDLFYHVPSEYLSNTLHRTYPRGFDIEIFSRSALERADQEAALPKEREHVTTYLISHPEKFSLANFALEEDLSAWRLTVDTEDDAALVALVLSHLGGSVSFERVRLLLRRHPEWRQMNAHVQQKQG